MSKIALSSNPAGTGVFTIASPNSNTNRTLNLPDATGTVQVSGNPISGTTASFSGDVTLGTSVLATPTGSAPSYTCRAWVNFNGTGTVAIRASGNVSSVSDLGVGTYQVNFATAMPDANYSSPMAVIPDAAFASGSAATRSFFIGSKAAGSVQLLTGYQAVPALVDFPTIDVAVFR